ncbi:hypothetical protein HMPREF0662_02621 [Prevotella nigrescens F0103]|nr:hypothetical protein HMPREF0662_02621 [Prevotella nigrescens F0103]
MNIKPFLLAASMLCSLAVFSQVPSVYSSDNSILGYYHLGMTAEETASQGYKVKEATEVSGSTETLSQYLMDINGVPFDVSTAHIGYGIDYSGYEKYTSEYLPLFFTGRTYFLDGKLISMTIHSKISEGNEEFMCYMPAGLNSQKTIPSNRSLFDVQKPEFHNQLVGKADSMVAYLSKKYGAPTKEYNIPNVDLLKEGAVAMDNFKAQWYSLCEDAAILPRAEWKQGNMTILMGISSNATLFISFYDHEALSHATLDQYFKSVKPTKAKVAW